MSLIMHIYVSAARRLFDPEDIRQLLAHCRVNNARDGITGMLLYHDGNFMQVLEGEAATITTVFTRIELDPRHHGILTLYHKPIAERSFADWSMAFKNVDTLNAEERQVHSSFFDRGIRDPHYHQYPTAARVLMESFRASFE